MSEYKLCAKCETEKPLDGGVYLSPFKWVCNHCWLGLTAKKVVPRNVPKNK